MMFLRDLRLACRRLAQSPGFAFLAVVTLALGIGAHTAIFGLIDALFLRPLALPDSDRLIGIYQTRDGGGFSPVGYPDLRDVREAATSLEALAVHYPTAPLTLRFQDESAMVNGSVVSGEYFSLLGVEAARGRLLEAADDADDRGSVVVLSHRAWASRFTGREDIVGLEVLINNQPFSVVGVAAEEFGGVNLALPSEVWIPLSRADVGYRSCGLSDRDCTFLYGLGKLRDRPDLATARVEIESLGKLLQETHPLGDGERGLVVEPLATLHPASRASKLRLVETMLAGVTALLLVAGANLAGLLVARGVSRRRETATHLAIGASPGRVVAMLLTETLLLTTLGGAGGLVVAFWLGRTLALLVPGGAGIGLVFDLRTAGYAVAASWLCGLLVAIAPALQASRSDLVVDLRGGARGGGQRGRLLGPFVVVQVALAFVLLSATGLLIRSVDAARVSSVEAAERVATIRLRPRLDGADPATGQAFTRAVTEQLLALPEVESVSASSQFWPVWQAAVRRTGDAPESKTVANTTEVGRRFFETLGAPMLRGRDFDARDTVDSAKVAIVNRALAESLWREEDAVGRALVVDGVRHEVVGVVEGLLLTSAASRRRPEIYTAYWQNAHQIDARLAVRTHRDASALLDTLLATANAVDPGVSVSELVTLDQRLAAQVESVDLAAQVLGASGLLSLALSSIGLYGVLALAVARRRRDIGIRMALGGSRGQVTAMMVRQALSQVAIAIAVGALISVLVARRLAPYLYSTSPVEPSIYATVGALLLATTAAAAWWPSRLAAQVDLLEALRQD